MVSTVVIAPDSFKGTATADEAAHAIGRGWAAVRQDDEIRYAPMADGGEGTVDAFLSARPGAEKHELSVLGPSGESVLASWVSFDDEDGTRTAVVEVANTSGITLLDELLPLHAHTRGFGQAIRDALDWGAEKLLLGLGGSSSTDGGAGVLRELGYRFLDSSGNEVPDGNHGLQAISRVDTSGMVSPPPRGAFVLSDVTNPLLGPNGAVAVFGEQKGITPETAPGAEAGLTRLVELLDPKGSLADVPGAGAAGGTGFGLLAWDARLEPGADAVATQIALRSAIDGAALVITGEGRYDSQTEGGKVPKLVADQANQLGAACALVAGIIEAPTEAFRLTASLSDLAGTSEAARRDALAWLTRAGRELAHAWTPDA